MKAGGRRREGHSQGRGGWEGPQSHFKGLDYHNISCKAVVLQRGRTAQPRCGAALEVAKHYHWPDNGG